MKTQTLLIFLVAASVWAQKAAPEASRLPEKLDTPPVRTGLVKGRWKIQYFYDKNQASFDINDICFPTEKRGIAVGAVTQAKSHKSEGLAILTRDGGATWTEAPLKEPGVSLFFLNESVGWMVTTEGIWKTEESGRTWTKLKKIKGVERVLFVSENHGWAVGEPKLMLETNDGGKTWAEVEAAKQVKSNPDFTSYHWIEFVSPSRGMVGGTVIPPRPGGNTPAWMDPERASKRREWPTLTITLETRDAGKTWTPQTAPMFGIPSRYRATKDGYSLALVRFQNSFEYPSEVFLIAPKGGRSQRTLRDKKRLVTDIGWLGPDCGVAVAIEPPGMFQLPIPGRLHVMETDSFTNWAEMPVDWKAYATEAVLSTAGEHAWIATDTGQILTLVRE